MNYTKTSGEFIKHFLPIFKNNNNEENTKLFKVLYNDIYKAYRESIKHSCLKGVLKN